ncbi:MAG: hypothetical protein ACK5LC_08420 [Coprobacillaceae bacterium]
MPELNFFQSIFCKDRVNIYISEEENDIDNIIKTSFSLENNDKTEDMFSKIITQKDEDIFDLSNKLESDNKGISSYYGRTVEDEINEHRNINIDKVPIVSGFIFDDINETDSRGFEFNKKEDGKFLFDTDIDNDTNSLIEKLKNDSTQQKESIELKSKEQLYKKDAILESDIDIPLL